MCAGTTQKHVSLASTSRPPQHQPGVAADNEINPLSPRQHVLIDVESKDKIGSPYLALCGDETHTIHAVHQPLGA